jgi:hypothetical protein
MYMSEGAMVRTQIYLTVEERDALAVLARASGKKQSELIREAVDALIHHFSRGRREGVLQDAAGIWKDRADLPDFAGLRKRWDRH